MNSALSTRIGQDILSNAKGEVDVVVPVPVLEALLFDVKNLLAANEATNAEIQKIHRNLIELHDSSNSNTFPKKALQAGVLEISKGLVKTSCLRSASIVASTSPLKRGRKTKVANTTTTTSSSTVRLSDTKIREDKALGYDNLQMLSERQKSPRPSQSNFDPRKVSKSKSMSVDMNSLVVATRNISNQTAMNGLISSIIESSMDLYRVEKFTLVLADGIPDKTVRQYSCYGKLKLSRNRQFREEPVIDLSAADSIPSRVFGPSEGLEIIESSLDPNSPFDEELKAMIKSEAGVSEPQHLLAIPIVGMSSNHATVVGALIALNPLNEDNIVPFSMDHVQQIRHLSHIAGSAISNLLLSEDRERAQQRIQSLLKMNQSVSRELDSDSVLDKITQVSYELLDADRIAMFLKVPGEETLYISHAQDNAQGMYIPSTSGIVGSVVSSGEMLTVHDAYNHPAFDKSVDEQTGYRTKSILCAPVKDTDGNILAVVEAINPKHGKGFTSEDALFLKYVAEAAGVSLHKSLLHQEMSVSRHLTEIRLKLANTSHSNRKINDFLEIVMDEGQKLMNVDRFGLMLVDPIKNELWITTTPPPGCTTGGLNERRPMGVGISGTVAEAGEPMCLRDAYDHPAFDPSVDKTTGIRTTSVLCFPVFARDTKTHQSTTKVVAVAMAINKKRKGKTVPFNSIDKKDMENFCVEIQLALAQMSLELQYYKVFADRAMMENSVERTLDKENAAEVDKTSSSKSIETGMTTSLIMYFKKDEEHHHHHDLVGANQLLNESLTFEPSSDVDLWDFDAFSLTQHDVGHMALLLLQAYDIPDTFGLSNDVIYSFMSEVTNNYNPMPFHNVFHGFQTMHAVHIMLLSECQASLSVTEIFATLIAALCHDLDHPGNNNDFEVKRGSAVAITHNDDAVLERHHCRMTFSILSKAENNIFKSQSAEEFQKVRKVIIAGILATDMTKHFELCKSLEASNAKDLFSHPIRVIEILVHSADLSGQALPLEQAKNWGDRVLTEFSNQVEKERELGLPIAPYMQNLESTSAALKLQIGFITFVLLPLWQPLVATLPKLDFYLKSLTSNFEHYKAELEKIETE